MMTHTPGPWQHVKAEYLSHDAPGYQQLLSSGGVMGGTPDEPSWVIEGEIGYAPDAALIAAAPDMLRELLDILDWAKVEKAPLRTQEIEHIERVIAKARGEHTPHEPSGAAK